MPKTFFEKFDEKFSSFQMEDHSPDEVKDFIHQEIENVIEEIEKEKTNNDKNEFDCGIDNGLEITQHLLKQYFEIK